MLAAGLFNHSDTPTGSPILNTWRDTESLNATLHAW